MNDSSLKNNLHKILFIFFTLNLNVKEESIAILGNFQRTSNVNYKILCYIRRFLAIHLICENLKSSRVYYGFPSTCRLIFKIMAIPFAKCNKDTSLIGSHCTTSKTGK